MPHNNNKGNNKNNAITAGATGAAATTTAHDFQDCSQEQGRRQDMRRGEVTRSERNSLLYILVYNNDLIFNEMPKKKDNLLFVK